MGVEKFDRPVLSTGHVWPNDRGVIQGVWDYDNTLPAQSVLADSLTRLNNNGLGPQTNNQFALPYAPNIFNTSTNQFDFSSLELGDTVDIRVSLSATTTAVSQPIKVLGVFGIGTEFEYTVTFVPEIQFKHIGTHPIGGVLPFHIGNDLTRDNPADIRVVSDSDLSVLVDGWYIRAFALKRFD